MKQLRVSLVVSLVSAGLVGCVSDDLSDLEQFVEVQRNKPPEPIEPLPEIRVYRYYEYNETAIRDPFVPLRQMVIDEALGPESSNGIRPDTNRRRELLEQFPLDSLDMVGTLERREEVFGLVASSDGTIHPVQEGNYLGQDFGRITGIFDDRIELVEIVPDGLGGWLERDNAIALGEE